MNEDSNLILPEADIGSAGKISEVLGEPQMEAIETQLEC